MTTSINSAPALTESYDHKIGKVTFRVSSFGNPNGAQTAQQMLLNLMVSQVKTQCSQKNKKEMIA